MFSNRRYRVRSVSLASLGIGIGSALLTWSAPSTAQDTTIIAPSAPATVETVAGYHGPNRILLSAGIATFGLAYTPAVVVAAESPLTADKSLYAPVAGPWVDLANRPDCGPRVSCDLEMVNKVLIATNGVFQGLGALATVTSFIFPEHHTKTVVGTNDQPTIQLTPVRLGSDGYGAAAVGSF
jgi:hypothetical protein